MGYKNQLLVCSATVNMRSMLKVRQATLYFPHKIYVYCSSDHLSSWQEYYIPLEYVKDNCSLLFEFCRGQGSSFAMAEKLLIPNVVAK